MGGPVTPQQLCNAVQHIEGIKVGNMQSVQKQMRLGLLKGNRFQIVLREVTELKSFDHGNNKSVALSLKKEMKKRLKVLQETGFVNYFGMQRFGSSTVGTHDIGR